MTKKQNWKKVVFNAILLWFFSDSLSFCQSAPTTVIFTKKEITFFKWGSGSNEVGLRKDVMEDQTYGISTVKKYDSYYWSRELWIDGNDNIYFSDSLNNRIFVISADGKPIKTVDENKTGGISRVDADGNIYGSHRKKGGSPKFTITRPDGTQKTYQGLNLKFEENGIVYDKNNNAITITDNGDKPDKLPPDLFSIASEKDFDFQNSGSSASYTIYSEKINKHLKKINRKLDVDQIKIDIGEKNDFGLLSDLIGIDDDGNSYFWCSYLTLKYSDPYEESDVMIFSQNGQKIGEISLELDAFNKQTDIHEVKLDIHGNIYQMLASEDGLHILKWIKN